MREKGFNIRLYTGSKLFTLRFSPRIYFNPLGTLKLVYYVFDLEGNKKEYVKAINIFHRDFVSSNSKNTFRYFYDDRFSYLSMEEILRLNRL